jgi:enoyl-CoA hydratase/carnithine racemase
MPWVVEQRDAIVVAKCDTPLSEWDLETQKVFASLLEALDSAHTEGVIITGRRAFDASVAYDDLGRVKQPDILVLVNALYTSATPVAAVISGVARGPGLEAALACGFRVAAPTARLEMPESALGLLPINGGVAALAACIGLGPTVDMLALGKVHDGVSACAIGLVDRCAGANVTSAVLKNPPWRGPRRAQTRIPACREDWEAELLDLGKRLRARAPASVANRALIRALELGIQHRASRAIGDIRQLAERCAASDQASALAYAWAAKAEDTRRGARPTLDAALRWTVLREAIHILDAGGNPDLIDRTLVGFGFVEGPLVVADRTGLGAILEHCAQAEHAWLLYSPTVDLMSGEGRLGASSGLGWYRYPRGKGLPQVDPSLDRTLCDSALAQRIKRRSFTPDEVVSRCLAAMVNGAFALLESGMAASALDIDGAWNRMGFPAWRGGLLYHADRWGLQTIVTTVLAANASRATLGPPAALLLSCASNALPASAWPLQKPRSRSPSQAEEPRSSAAASDLASGSTQERAPNWVRVRKTAPSGRAGSPTIGPNLEHSWM